MHVMNVMDSAVQILQSLWRMVMMTWMIETNALNFFKHMKFLPLLIFLMIFVTNISKLYYLEISHLPLNRFWRTFDM